MLRYNREGLLKAQGRSLGSVIMELFITKSIYYGYLLVLPLIFSPVAWWVTILGFLALHFVLGFLLAIVFQPAHVVDGTHFIKPSEEGSVENNWAVHQILTTANFAPKNKILSWFVGGLNYQIEHHLFPTICHIHYRKLSKIVRETTKEFDLPYNCQPSFRAALRSHARLLKELGTGTTQVPAVFGH